MAREDNTSMQVDLDQILLGADDKTPLQQDGGDESKPATLAWAVATACFAPIDTDAALAPLRKAEIGELGLRLYKGGLQEINSDDRVLLNERAGKIFPNLVVARIRQVLK